MKFPETIEILNIEDENEALDKLDALEVDQLLELQKVADRITELLSIVFLAREYGALNDSTNSEM